MPRSIVRLPSLVIPATSNVSNILDSRKHFDDAVAILLVQDGSTLDALTYTIEVTADDDPSASSTWGTLQESGADVTVPGLSKAKAFDITPWRGVRIKASGATTNPATWEVCKEMFI